MFIKVYNYTFSDKISLRNAYNYNVFILFLELYYIDDIDTHSLAIDTACNHVTTFDKRRFLTISDNLGTDSIINRGSIQCYNIEKLFISSYPISI